MRKVVKVFFIALISLLLVSCAGSSFADKEGSSILGNGRPLCMAG